MLSTKQKLKNLKDTEKYLIAMFIGIAPQIRQLCNSIKAWYLFPETLSKPLVVNLWGITGTFKTSLARELLVRLGVFAQFVEVDARDLQSGMMPILGHPNTDKKDIVMPLGVIIDEFQTTRTIDMFGNDTDRADGLGELFSFLSDGKVQVNRGNYKVEQISFLRNRIKTDIDAVVQQIEEFYDQRSSGRRSDSSPSGDVPVKSKETKKQEPKEIKFTTKMNYFYEYYIDKFTDLVGEDFSKIQFRTPQEALLAVYVILAEYGPTKTFDLRGMLVINTGNLDEAFDNTRETDTDIISPDEFYAEASKVNFNQIKQALLTRFKPEQVARLGSNHIIFPSFNTEMYKALITSLNKRSIAKFKDLGMKIKIDKSVDEFILKFNAVPSQGARSVLSAHEYLVDSNLSEIIAETMISGGKEVLIGIVNNKVHLINDKKKLIKKNIDIIDLNVLKNYEDPRTNHVIATHEAGHAILNIALYGQLPSTIKVRMNDNTVGGFCTINGIGELPNRREMMSYISVALAGYCAELIDNNYNADLVSTGASSDILSATNTASQMVKVLGLGNSGSLLATGYSMSRDGLVNKNSDAIDSEIEDIVNEALTLTLVTLEAMKKEHKALVDILKKNVTVKPKDIVHIFV